MALNYYFFNAVYSDGTYDRTYNAEDVTSYLDQIVGSGVFPTPSTQLQVQASSGMIVNVLPGSGWIDGHKLINTATLPLTIATANVQLPRIDRVIFYVDYDAREMGIDVLQGTPAASPVGATLTRTASRYEMCLAEITVGKQVTSISASVIKDTRGDSTICGYVAGLIQQIDTTTLFQQFQAGFEDWFGTVQETLATTTLMRRYEGTYVTTSTNESTFNVKNLIASYNYALDILEVRINGLTLRTDEYTQNQNTVTLVTPVEEAGTPVTFTVYKSIDGSDAESVVDLVSALETELDATRITSPTGGVKLSLTSSSANVLNSFIGLGIGFHTIYAASAVQGLPGNKSCRMFGHMTDTASGGNGYLFAVDYEGSVYVNYLVSGTWTGWRALYEANPSLLWSGSLYPNNNVTITPTKKLSECRNGWLITFADFDPATQTPYDLMVQTCCIPKKSYDGSNYNGEQVVFPLYYSLNQTTGDVLSCAKVFNVYDDRLVSTPYNVTTPSTYLVLRSIQEY